MSDIGRQHPSHGVHITLVQPTIVFLTVCTKDRKPWLASNEVHQLLRQVWSEATAWQVGRYVLMRDHVHLFCAPSDQEITLDAWTRYWKSQFTKLSPHNDRRWQPRHWDTRLRHGESYHDKWNYVCANPVRAELVTEAVAWPFQGELNVLPW
ncbi:MAG TPA: hypothetical protein VNB29_08435 [Chthoniobacterales bacterium]|nr:hypothetical protein [Chthoniobacterales bacterium]